MTPDRLYAVVEATWPSAATRRIGSWTIREGQGGGKRVCAATAEVVVFDNDIAEAEAAMEALSQPKLFMIRDGEAAFDVQLAALGYNVIDPVAIYAVDAGVLTTEPVPPVSAFEIWPPMAIQRDIWAEGGIGTGRLAVMDRACEPKTSILARTDDQPAGTAFVAIHDGMAMIHAIEVAPKLRRQGVGANIMRAAAHWAARNGADKLTLLVTSANRAANALYTCLGMKVVGHYHYRIK